MPLKLALEPMWKRGTKADGDPVARVIARGVSDLAAEIEQAALAPAGIGGRCADAGFPGERRVSVAGA